jgi:hypothetical protein
LSSPARVVVELPATVMATAENKIAVGSAGVKGIRIGMDGKTPPTTSVVVDTEQALAYDMSQGTGNKLVLTLHTQAAAPVVAKSAPTPAPMKTSVVVAKPQVVAAKPLVTTPAPTPIAKSNPAPAAKPADAFVAKKPVAAAPVAVKVEAPKPSAKPTVTATTTVATNEKPTVASKTADAPKALEAPKAPKAEEKKWAMSGKRDPFFSPVVQQPTGPGCSTGKKCLDIGQINLRGVVKSESGFIAVVTNSLNKAYFLHENDPVFNGYVVKITGDSVVFEETVQDKLGKPFTREVVKRIFTPAV